MICGWTKESEIVAGRKKKKYPPSYLLTEIELEDFGYHMLRNTVLLLPMEG